jgi:hypothetical protein
MKRRAISFALTTILTLCALCAGADAQFAQQDTSGRAYVNTQSGKVSYRAAIVTYSPYATPTDVMAITGAAGKVVRVTRWYVWGSSTAASNQDWFLIKRSTANTGGTPTTMPAVPLDSANVAAQAVVVTYAAAPTTGNSLGLIGSQQIGVPAAGAAGGTGAFWEFGIRNTQAPVLRSASEVIALNFNGAAVPAGTELQLEIEWTEE